MPVTADRRAMRRTLSFCLLLAIATAASAADLKINFVGGQLAPIGHVTNLDIDISNGGTDAATNASFTYTPPPQLTYASYRWKNTSTRPDATITPSCTAPRPGDGGTITCTVPTLPAKGSFRFYFSLNVPQSVAPGTTLSHTASTATQTSSFANTAAPFPDLRLSHTFPANVVGGQRFDFTISIENASSFDAPNVYFYGVTLGWFIDFRQSAGAPQPTCSDDFGYIHCSSMTIPARSSVVFTVTVDSDPEVSFDGDLFDDINTVLSPLDFFSEGIQQSDSLSPVIPFPDPAVAITAPQKATVNVPYPVHVMSYAAGPSSTRKTTLTFTTPPGTTFQSLEGGITSVDYVISDADCSTPAAGTSGTITCTIPHEVPAYRAFDYAGERLEFDVVLTPTATGTVTATASVSSPTDLDPTNDSASATTTIISAAVTDLAASLQQTLPLSGNDPVYTATAKNKTSADVNDVVLAVTFPAGVTSSDAACSGTPLVCRQTFAVLSAGAARTMTVHVHVPDGTPSIVASATVSSSTVDSDTSNDTASITTFLGNSNGGELTLTAAIADVYGNPQPLPAAVSPGARIVYTVAAAPTASTLTLMIPAGSRFVDSSGSSVTTQSDRLIETVIAPSTPGTYAAQATMSGSSRSASVSIVVASNAPNPPSAADLSVRVDAPMLVPPGDPAGYAVSVLNCGPQAAGNVRLTVTLPPGATLDHVDAPAGVTCGTPLVCSIASLANGATAIVNVVVRPPRLALGTPLALNASVTADTADGNPKNNQFAAATTIAYPTKLSIRVDPPVVAVPPGAQFVTTITVTNNGQAALSGVKVEDYAPIALNAISVHPTANATCVYNTSIACNASVLNPGEQIVITAVMKAPQSGSVTQLRFTEADMVDTAVTWLRSPQTVVVTAHPKHRAAP